MRVTTYTLALMACLAMGIAGCSKEPVVAPFAMPEVSDANCKTAAIKAMPVPEEEQREFGSKCARRGSYTPSPTKVY